ncbi:RND transporter [Pandoraea terrae]|uniref:RND transporter n=1 Tax=Pandoraea terrae TaxID=1537710 RepID=A0A5E4U9D9_9BURK|nr:MMPL family transporter [Pandoraea terrae]VVD96122.1 RND transporter [Pandoraea terrae]
MNHLKEAGEHGPSVDYQHPASFDKQSGSRVERLFFNHRRIVVVLCALITIVLGLQASKLQLAASFERMLPSEHPYVSNFRQFAQQLSGSGNVLRITVATKRDSVFYPEYLEKLRKINDEVYLYQGVDRAYMKSIYMAAVRWMAVTEQGLEGGPVMPDGFDGSPAKLAELRNNIERSGQIGQLVAADYKSTIVLLPLLDVDYNTGKPLDYQALNHKLEQLRAKYQSQDIQIHVTGFAKVAGDLLDGLRQILLFFAVAIAICTAVLFWYTRCWRSTLLVVTCSLVAVIWLLGLLPLLGFTLNPYSILVPFLVFAIGMSHGAQKMNGIMQDIGRGAPKLMAARLTFRRLFLAGLTALLADAVGFAVLMVIKIPVIQDLALAASLGVAVLIFTNLVLLPILLSYAGVSPTAALRSLKAERMESEDGQHRKHPFWAFLDLFTERKWASLAVVAAAALGGAGFVVSLDLKIGDLDPGAPELRADSRYNRDNAYVVGHYAASSDVYTVMVPTPKGRCSEYSTLLRVHALESRLRALPGVESTLSFVGTAKNGLVGFAEGNPKWYELSRDQASINSVTQYAPRETLDAQCSFLTIQTYLTDHKADTLTAVSRLVDEFGAQYNSEAARFLPAAGNAGVEAATNIVVKQANRQMLMLVYGAVIILAFITFRSWRAVLCAVLPLVLTSILSEALMVWLGIGVKVATLPVVALGVGIGVDYALYVLSVTLANLRAGKRLSEAYYGALLFTGKVVVLTGITLGIAVATWAFSPIKFQGDMGILLAFMFLWNMLGALILLPALGHFLLRERASVGVGAVGGETPASLRQSGVTEQVDAGQQVVGL